MKKALRIISGIMFAAAILFLSYALMHPEAGSTFYIFGFPIGVKVWQAFYVIYLTVMTVLFLISFFIKNNDAR